MPAMERDHLERAIEALADASSRRDGSEGHSRLRSS